MSKDWAGQELQAVSQVMQAAGYMGYEENSVKHWTTAISQLQPHPLPSQTMNSPQKVDNKAANAA